MNVEWIILVMMICIMVISLTTMEYPKSLMINILFISLILFLKLLIKKVDKEHEV